MSLRQTQIRQSANRPNLFMGGDRELVMFSGLLAFALIFSAFEFKAFVFGTTLWVFALFALRLLKGGQRESVQTLPVGASQTT